MAKPYFDMDLITFQRRFGSEEACRKRLFELRWPEGFRCPRCGCQDAYYLEKRSLYQCIDCKFQTSLTAGTVMHRTRTPLVKWFWAIYLVATDKRGLSALALSRKVDLGLELHAPHEVKEIGEDIVKRIEHWKQWHASFRPGKATKAS